MGSLPGLPVAPGDGPPTPGLPSRRRPTLRDVAALAGVSFKTVSRVVNGEPGVSPAVADRVREAADQLGYRPNAAATALRRADGRTATFGVLLEDSGNPFFASLLRGIEDGYFTGEIADAAFAYSNAVEKGDKKIVGVNTLTGGVGEDLKILRIPAEVEQQQNALLARRRVARDEAVVRASLDRMVAVARGGENMVPAMLDAVRAEATLGEICDALRAEWGVYTEPARI